MPALPLEKHLEQALKKAFEASQAQRIFADYIYARDSLAKDILRYIVAAEPNLTDHGIDHINNVLEIISLLLQDQIMVLNAAEIYTLIISVLFHDVGNLFKRHNHHKKIGDIYEHVRNSVPRFADEKCLIVKIVEAHTGKAIDGSYDTLDALNDTDILLGKQIRSRTLAAILRLADELAEGQQRTSDYIIKAHGFEKNSMIFHNYAQITTINPDRGNQRLALTYNFRLKTKDGRVIASEKAGLLKLLEFTYARIIKLDEERKYTKHYTTLLEPFKQTSVRFNFHLGSALYDHDLGDLTLSDKIVPGGNAPQMAAIFPKCDPARIWKQLSHVKLEKATIKYN